jgi:hypothetical protein
LCGQICLHKLVDLFISGAIAVRAPAGAIDDIAMRPDALDTDAGRNSAIAAIELEPAAKLVAPPDPVLPQRLPLRAHPELVAMPGRPQSAKPGPHDETPRYASSNWRAEAWDRERERELRAVELRPEGASRRRSGS